MIDRHQAIALVQNFDDSLMIIKSAAEWRTRNDILYSEFWDPKKISKATYLEEFYEHNAYALYIDGIPTATATLTDPSEMKNETWDKLLGKDYEQGDCLYIDYSAVIGERIGQGIARILFREVDTLARNRGYASLRLDCDARLDKLVRSYERCGFKEVCTKDVGYRTSTFMARIVTGN